MNTSFVSTVNGETLFTIETSDTESDALTYTITCDPSDCPIDKSPKGMSPNILSKYTLAHLQKIQGAII